MAHGADVHWEPVALSIAMTAPRFFADRDEGKLPALNVRVNTWSAMHALKVLVRV